MEPDKEKPENRRTEYTVLRAEILQADNICLLMMGYLITAVGFLYSEKEEWLVSFLSFISLCYFTEKRFSIRKISSYIASEICEYNSNSGFRWEKHVQELRKQRQLRPIDIFRPYNAEVITCSAIAFPPIFKLFKDYPNFLINFSMEDGRSFFSLVFAVLTLILSILNFCEYKKLRE